MFYLSESDAERWRGLAGSFDTSALDAEPERLRPALCYYLGAGHLAAGRLYEARQWLQAGVLEEPVRASAYLLDYLDRHDGSVATVLPSFEDPRPWAHFSSLPHLKTARETMISFCTASLPDLESPVRMMDIGCGNGALTVSLLERLVDSGGTPGVGDVLLLDPSEGMLDAAAERVSEAFPGARITTVADTLQGCSEGLPGGYDVALCALSVHHMPRERKVEHIGRLASSVGHLLIFELGANHDLPEMLSPELVYSVYQTFGQSLEYIYAREAPEDVRRACADIFVMTEALSLLFEPRGKRTEYHMMRHQWHELLSGFDAPSVTCMGERTCYCDPYCEVFALHYVRDRRSRS